MKTTFETKEPYRSRFLAIAEETEIHSPARPVRFIRKMKMNKGSLGHMTGAGLDKDGLERRNPLIVALGDSVTAGHFEGLAGFLTGEKGEKPSEEQMKAFFEQIEKLRKTPAAELEAAFDRGELFMNPAVEITDVRASYVDQFRGLLIDKYEQTSVSVVNAGIAGDMLISMAERADRDVISMNPDLVLINGSLNWDLRLGTTKEYKEILKKLVQRIKAGTEADIILLTPNAMVYSDTFPAPPEGERLSDRVRAIREVAEEEQVCLSDTFAVWEEAEKAGIPLKELLANGINHPSVTGHTVYAKMLMKLLEE